LSKQVIIVVKGAQTYEGRESDGLELVTEGKYYKKGDAYFITYKESEVTGMDGTTTTLKVMNGIVTLMRFGSVNSHFIFERGQKYLSYYETPNGTFTVGVLANDVNINIGDNGGEIHIGYELEIDNTITGENEFQMFIREAGQANDKFN
jgi:uncharacterized beta-barrel protein YwiB (DUF1934 family)